MTYSLYIIGFPSLYGGAGAELYHQIKVWKQMGVEMHLIPTQKNAHGAGLYPEMVKLGVAVHEGYDWEAIPAGAPVISFCNEEFLAALPKIRKRTGRTVFVNCMTWLFGREKEAMRRGDISLFLYQNSNVMGNVMPRLRALNPDPAIRFMTFRPYFDAADFPFAAGRSTDWFGAGHISRQDEDKFSKDTWHIYEHFASPVRKKGTFLGFDRRSEAKTGRPPDWVETFHDQKSLSQQSFTGAATSFCSPPIRRRIGRVWVLRPWQAGVCLLWTGAGGGNKWWNTGRPDGCANAPVISSRTPLRWLGSPTTGKTWPLPPVSGAWPWAARKLPWKAGRRCLRQSAGYRIREVPLLL